MTVYSFFGIPCKLQMLLISKEERARLLESAIARESGKYSYITLVNKQGIDDVEGYLKRRSILISLADNIKIERVRMDR